MLAFWTRERKGSSLDVLAQLFATRNSKSGAAVSWKTALDVTTVLACARVIAEGVSQVPLQLMREKGNTRLPATDHDLYPILYRRPNSWQTSFEFRETLAIHLVLTGNAYSFINRGLVSGAIRELVPLEPQMVSVSRANDGTLTYDVQANDGTQQRFPAESIWHVRGPSWNSYLGMEAVYLAREAIGLAMRTEEAHASLHRNGAQIGGTYSIDGALTKEQYQQLSDWIATHHEGAQNAGRAMILDRGAKWFTQAMTGVDAQHLETRKFQIEEICRALRVMPIMVGYSDKTATYASAEQMFLAHVVHTLSPWYQRIEQSINVNLLTEQDYANGVYANFCEEDLLRGAMKDTADYLTTLTNAGILMRNEARALLDKNPLPGLDEPLMPANSMPGANPQPAAEPQGA